MIRKLAFLLYISLYTESHSLNLYQDIDRGSSLIFRDMLCSEIRQSIQNKDYYKIHLHSNTIYSVWENLITNNTTNMPLSYLNVKDIHAPVLNLIESFNQEINTNEELKDALQKLIEISNSIAIKDL